MCGDDNVINYNYFVFPIHETGKYCNSITVRN